MNILYIAGYGRSGSSILSRLIGQHPGFLSLGELGRLVEFVQGNKNCTCGSPVSMCPFWGEMLKSASSADPRTPERGDFWPAEILRNKPGFLIDSSKTAYRGFLRPLRYLFRGHPLYLIHLVRNPDQVVKSALKGRNKDIERGVARRRPFETARTLVAWSYANLFASCYRLLLGRRAILVRYEDLLLDPSAELRRIGELAGADFSETAALLEEGRPLATRHEIAGNRTLRSSDAALRPAPAAPVRPGGLGWRIFFAIVRPIGGR